MAINQISSANTFEQWLIATQELIAFANSQTGAGGTFTSNTSEYVITGNLSVGNTVTCVTMNTDVIIFNDGTRLTSNVSIVNSYIQANAAFDKANAANVLAQNAYNYANTANILAQNAYDYANTILTGGSNLVVTGNVIGNTITANSSISTSNLTVTNNVTTGNLTAGLITATDINTTSDISLKTNLSPISNPLNVLEKITGLEFNWKSNGEKSYGVSAQELEKILPEIVKTRDDGFKGVNYLNLIAFLVEGIKELNKELNEVKKIINK